ncbi:MAG: hypothetical protein MUF87_12655, partial [Anaerolineae bacterium]|nr:hypothetical protein [Anaerolineae bacterium]
NPPHQTDSGENQMDAELHPTQAPAQAHSAFEPTQAPAQAHSAFDPTQAPAQTYPVFEPAQAPAQTYPVFEPTQAPTQTYPVFEPTQTEAYADPYPYHLPQAALIAIPSLPDPIDQDRRNTAILFIEDLFSHPHPPNLLDIQRVASAHDRDFKRLYPHADLDLIQHAETLLSLIAPFINDDLHTHLRRLFSHLR